MRVVPTVAFAALMSMISLAAGCTPTGPSSDDPPPSAAAGRAVAPEAGQPAGIGAPATPPTAEVAGPETKPGPLEVAWRNELRRPSSFRIDRELEDMSDHPVAAGFAREDDQFFFRLVGGGRVCDSWLLFDAPEEKPSDTLTHGEECDDPAPKKAIDDRMHEGDYAIRDGEWNFGGEVVLVLQERSGAKDGNGVARGEVRIGARLRTPSGETTPAVAWFDRIEACIEDSGLWCAPDVHVDYVAPSPSGRFVAILLHSFAGEYMDGYPLIMLEARDVAMQAHNAEGLARLRAGDLEVAEARFVRAASVDPKGWKAPYNLACVRSHAGDLTGAAAALHEAERRGGGRVREKATTDPDLAALRASGGLDLTPMPAAQK